MELQLRPHSAGGIDVANPKPMTLASAIQAVIVSKTAANLRPKYVVSLRQYLNLFAAGREEMALEEFTTDMIDAWFASRKEAPVSRASNVGRLRSLFTFAHRRGFIRINPCDALERIRLDMKPPRVLTPAECAALLQACPAHCRGFLTLGLFAGIRPEEIYGLTWADVRTDLKAVVVNMGKTRRRRIVPLELAAVAWLAACDRGLPLCPSARAVRRARGKLTRAIGGTWPQDVLRHTAASYLLQLHGDAGKVALTLGNSAGILLRHYHNSVSAEDCGIFWSLKPLNEKGEI